MDTTKQESSPRNNSTDKRARRIKQRRVGLVILFILSLAMFASTLVALGYFLAVQTRNPVTVEQQRQTIASEGEVIADIAEEVSPSVVSIVTEQRRTINSVYGPRSLSGQAAGTGVIIDTDGHILTNKHVVPEGTSTVEVIMSDGVSYSNVAVLARDPLNDIAILKVSNPKNFKPATLGVSDDVRTGQKVIAIGNALGQFQNTVTSGIISGVGRPVEAGDQSGENIERLTNLFQTDAAINSGNSGGPLLDFNGTVIGINTAVAADAQNIGFAIPIDEVKSVINSVKETGSIQRAFLGVRFTMLTPQIARENNVSINSGAYVLDQADAVVPDSPAAQAGIKPGDVITKINNISLSAARPLDSIVGRFKIGDTVTLQISREGKNSTVRTTLSQIP